jgi:hypothetical protein
MCVRPEGRSRYYAREDSLARARTRFPENVVPAANFIETIRYYEKIGIMPNPPRNNSGYLIYSSSHLGRLSFVRRDCPQAGVW